MLGSKNTERGVKMKIDEIAIKNIAIRHIMHSGLLRAILKENPEKMTIW